MLLDPHTIFVALLHTLGDLWKPLAAACLIGCAMTLAYGFALDRKRRRLARKRHELLELERAARTPIDLEAELKIGRLRQGPPVAGHEQLGLRRTA